MSEYILNSTPVKTSNNYGINDIKLDFEIPEIKDFNNIEVNIDKKDVDKIGENWLLEGLEYNDETDKEMFETDIGLTVDCNSIQKFNIKENEILNKPIIVTCNFDKNNNILSDYFEIYAESNSKSSFIIIFKDDNSDNIFHYMKQVVYADDNAEVNICLINLLNSKAKSFLAFENELSDNAILNHDIIDFGGKVKVSNYYSDLVGFNSQNNIKNIYLGTNKDVLDINYNINNIGEHTKCNILSQGALSGESKKNFKGTIDFKEGSIKAKGIENENCILLSDKSKSKSLPMLLCHEEDVQGEHGVSTGKPDKNKIFYMMSRGLSYSESIKLIVKANFDIILNDLDDDLKNNLDKYIDENIGIE